MTGIVSDVVTQHLDLIAMLLIESHCTACGCDTCAQQEPLAQRMISHLRAKMEDTEKEAVYVWAKHHADTSSTMWIAPPDKP